MLKSLAKPLALVGRDRLDIFRSAPGLVEDVSGRSRTTWPFALRVNGVIPLRQDLASFDPDGCLLFLRDFDASRIMSRIQHCPASQTCRRGRVADEANDRFVVLERLAFPVGADPAEQAVLDGIPFRRPWWVVGYGDRHAPAVCQLLQGPFPGPGPRTVRPTAVSFNEPVLCLWATPAAMVFPPAREGSACEFCRLVRRANHDEASAPKLIVNPKRDSAALGEAGKVVVQDVDRLLRPCASRVLEQPHQFLLLGVDADRRISLLLKAPPLPGNVAKLPIPLRFVNACQSLTVGPQRIATGFQQSTDCVGANLDAVGTGVVAPASRI